VPRLSIVIPWLGPAGPFEDTLASVLQNRPSGCEIVVALARPYDDPYHLGDEVTFVVPPAGTSTFVPLLNAALAQAKGHVVQVLPCGLKVTEDWTSAALLHFDDPQVAAVAPLLVRESQPDRIVCAGIDFTPGGARRSLGRGERPQVTQLAQSRPLGAPLAGGFFRHSLLEALGGFDATLAPCAADLDLALCAAALELRTECEPTSVIHAPLADDTATFAAGRGLERLYWRHRAGGEPAASLATHYGCWLWEWAAAGVRPAQWARCAGRLVGWMGARSERDPAPRIEAARARLAAASAPRVLPMTRATSPAPAPSQRRAA
jgi:hypothetical protein